MSEFYRKTSDETLESLEVNENGLTDSDVNNEGKSTVIMN